MNFVNGALRPLFDALLLPFRALPPIVGLLVVSLVAAIGMLLVYKRTSNQDRLEAVKRQIHACLFEIRLFKDDVPAILRAQTEILRHNAKYLALSLVPMLWMIVPLTLVIAQLQFHYGYRGLRPGEDFIVKARLSQLFSEVVMRDRGRPPGDHGSSQRHGGSVLAVPSHGQDDQSRGQPEERSAFDLRRDRVGVDHDAAIGGADDAMDPD